ncbi:TBC1 domain family member 22B [Bagarius yarrelli]|uniref:TBC1 domain family member 22B n=1 Tax=Bagarius yarrelli TaxID=175774 RepID=A0A556UG53_BAGYA|nr:TBC1 domain family member 22B [Bagarius yarrelli]
MAADNKIHFWRRNAKGPGSLQPIYGAQYPPLDPRVLCSFLKDAPKTNAVNVKSKKPSTFHEFARSTNDAWDIDDEEDGTFFTPAHSASAPGQSHSIVKAPRLKGSNRVTDKEPEPRPLDRSEPGTREFCQDQLRPSGESANGGVVKSSSDVQLNSNSDRSTLQKQHPPSIPVRPIIPLVARISDQNASGAPPMTGYLPANMERRDLVLQRKREEYFGFIEQYYHSRTDEHHKDTYRQDNYTFAQPGIQKKVKALEELISRIDEDVHLHIQKCEVEYLQFAFRWMNNLLMRELPLRCTIRLWDTYQGEKTYNPDSVETTRTLTYDQSEHSQCKYQRAQHRTEEKVRDGQLAVGTCEVVMLNRDSSQPKRTIARQTARCACRRGQIAGTTRARPACVDARIVKSRQWCEMTPCSEGEICGLLFNQSGWTCTKGGGRIKTVTVKDFSVMIIKKCHLNKKNKFSEWNTVQKQN